MWIVARFLPTSLFSLRPALSTSSGAQSLLVPTPFSIKMALLNNALHLFGAEAGAQLWPVLRDLEVALACPDVIVVNKTFIKIQRPTRFNRKDEAEVNTIKDEGLYPFNPTIAFREFVQFGGEVGIALRLHDQADDQRGMLSILLQHINYLGKRGSFWQLLALPTHHMELDERWTLITTAQTTIATNGTLQILDDCGVKLSWEHVNIYSGKSIKISNDERVLRPIVLPYGNARSSYRYTLYQRLKAEEL